MPISGEPLEETLQRLKRDREEADRRYNDALTALDAALPRLPDPPEAPPAYDEHQVRLLNEAWNIGAEPASFRGIKGRLAAFVWAIVGPMLQKQLTFNSTVVDHINRNLAAHRESRRAIEGILCVMRAQVQYLASFHTRLIVYLQQITAYVDTRDRETAGGALIVNAAVNALSDDGAKRAESLAARDQRVNARVEAISAAHDELRMLIGVSQQATLTVKRELERLQSLEVRDRTVAMTGAPESASAFSQPLDAYKYVGFEDQFRGSQETIRERLQSYLPYFKGAKDVLDVGCGRGEFLDLLAANGITARGLDLNHEMVEVCRARGLDVTEADVVTYLEGVPDASLGGLFAAQVVEHLQPGYLLRFLELAHHKLRPGARIVLETLNPACWVAFFDSFIRDITHVWPLHPETLRYLVLASGFSAGRIEYRSPVAPQDKLQPIAVLEGVPADVVETLNANVEKLNSRMFTFLDYAVIGDRST